MTETEPKHIKIRFDGESCWAFDLGDGKAKIDNSPLDDNYNLGDIVTVDFNGRVTGLIERTMKKTYIKYDGSGTTEEVKSRYKQIYLHLESHKMAIEGMVIGMAAVSYPQQMTDEEVLEIFEKSPVPIILPQYDEQEETE